MINNYLKHIAYICPLCSEINEKSINIFEISDIEFICEDTLCKEECLSFKKAGEKLKIQINCPVCGNIHNFNISFSSLYLKDIFTLSCPESGIKILFAGDKEKVEAAVSENSELISKIATLLGQNESELEFFYDIIDLLYEYINDDKISCSCGGTNIIPDIDNNQDIILFCEDCGKELKITPTEDTLDELFSSGFIKL